MTHILKRSVILMLALATVAWSTLLFAVPPASAAGCTSGTLISGSLPAVYYCGGDGKRYVFPNEKTYSSWYSDFSGVTQISDADLATVQIGGNVTYRPGVKMVKITTDPKVYAVSANGTLRPIADEATAVALYGSAWNTMIHDVPDAFFTNYSIGSVISSASDYDKTAEMSASQSINEDKGLAPGVTTGGVSKASDSPNGATLPLGAMGVNFLKFNVANSGTSAMTIDSATVLRQGPGATSDLSAVYLFEGAERLTTGRSVNSSTNEVNFTGLNLELAAGVSRTLWVAVDVATGASAGNVHSMSVTSVMSAGANLAGTPVTGANFTLAGATVGSLAVAKTGAISNPKLGELQVKVAEFSVAAGSSEDIRLDRLTLFQGGNLSAANLTNLTLKHANNTVATSEGFNSKLRTTFSIVGGMLLEKGATKNFQVYADIGGAARSGDTLKLYVEEDSDVHGVGVTYGHGVTVTRGTYDGDSCTTVAGDCSYSLLEAGQVTLNFLGPNTADVQTNTNDVELFRFTMVAQSNVEVKNLRTNIAASASAAGASGLLTTSNVANFTDIKVTNVGSGSVWWGPMDVSGTDGTPGDNDLEQDLVFTDVQNLVPGVLYEFAVTADTESTATGGESLTFRLDAFTGSDLRNLDNSTFLTPSSDVVPSGALTGNPMTLRSAYLGVGLNGLALSNSYVKGSSDIAMLGASFASEFGTVTKLTSLTVTGFIDADGASDYVKGQDVDGSGTVSFADTVTSCYLLDAGTGELRGDLESPGSGTDGSMTFNNLDWEIDSIGATMIVYCNLSNSAYRNSNSERVYLQITAGSDGTTQDLDGNTVSFLGGFPINNASAIITVLDGGSLTIVRAPDDTESEAGLVIAGQSNVSMSKFRLTAQDEELKLTKVRASLATASNYTNLISMSIYDGATLMVGPVPVDSSGNADFSGMALIIPKDGSVTMTVKAELNSVSGGATSGADLQVNLHVPGTDDSTFDVRGTASSTVLKTLGATLVQSTGTLTFTGVVIDGEQVAIGPATVQTYEFDTHSTATVTASTTRVNISGTSAAAQGTLTVDTQPTNGDTMTIGAKTYTFQTNGGLTDVDGNIEIGGSLGGTQTNILNAINLSGTPGTGYAASMTLHPTVSAAAFAANAMVLTAKAGGTAGNSLTSTETFFTGTNVFDAATLGTTTAGDDTTAAEAVTALAAAVTASDTKGVGGVDGTGDVVDFTADTAGATGNNITTTETLANGSFGSATLTGGTGLGDVSGRQKIIRKTKPTVSLASLPTTTLTDGSKTIARITVTADSAEQVSLKTLVWTIAKTTGVTADVTTGSSVREVGQGSNIAGASFGAGTSCDNETACTIATTFSSEQIVAAGTSKTYELVMTIASTASGDSISTNIGSDAVLVTNSLDDTGAGTDTGDSLTGDATNYNVIWSDNSAIPHNDTLTGSADWTNGLYVKVLPSDAQTLTAL